MMVTDLRCWWQNHYVGNLFRCVGDEFIKSVINILNLSPTHFVSNIRHQHWCLRLQSCWWPYGDGNFWMLVTEFRPPSSISIKPENLWRMVLKGYSRFINGTILLHNSSMSLTLSFYLTLAVNIGKYAGRNIIILFLIDKCSLRRKSVMINANVSTN